MSGGEDRGVEESGQGRRRGPRGASRISPRPGQLRLDEAWEVRKGWVWQGKRKGLGSPASPLGCSYEQGFTTQSKMLGRL